MAFARRIGDLRNVWVRNLEMGSEVNLTTFAEASPLISPDGRKIAYSVWENNQNPIYVVDLDGGSPHRVPRIAAAPLAGHRRRQNTLFRGTSSGHLRTRCGQWKQIVFSEQAELSTRPGADLAKWSSRRICGADVGRSIANSRRSLAEWAGSPAERMDNSCSQSRLE